MSGSEKLALPKEVPPVILGGSRVTSAQRLGLGLGLGSSPSMFISPPPDTPSTPAAVKVVAAKQPSPTASMSSSPVAGGHSVPQSAVFITIPPQPQAPPPQPSPALVVASSAPAPSTLLSLSPLVSRSRSPSIGDDVRRKTIGDYQCIEVIGKGANGIVYKAINVKTGELVAVKSMKKNTKLAEGALSSFNKEIQILQGLRHPNVVKVIGSVSESDSLSMILEFVDGGSLASILTKCGRYPENLAAIYMDQVLAGLQYLHENSVLHRDVKGGNILVTKEGVAKLVDFGCAAAICADMSKRVTVVGSPYWMSPEVVGMTGQCAQSDVWSFAATILELVTSQPPYWGMPPVSAMFHIVQDPAPPLPSDISEELTDLLHQCFNKDPQRRPSAAELRKHPWFARYKPDAKTAYAFPELLANVQQFNQPKKSPPSDPEDFSPPPPDDASGFRVEELAARVKQLKTKVHRQRSRRKRVEMALAELRERLSLQQADLRERNKTHNALLDYFNLLYLAIKMSAAEEGKVNLEMNGAELYEEAARKEIDWHHWHIWLPRRIEELSAQTAAASAAASAKAAMGSPMASRKKK